MYVAGGAVSADQETLAVYDAKAAEYDEVFYAGQAGPHLRRFMDAVVAGGRILDLGCGPGNAAALMQAEGFVMTCVDASAEMVKKAVERGLDARLQTFDEIGGEAIYDGVWANFSLLHAPREDLPRHLAALSQAMKVGGAFHIGMKVGSGRKRDGLGRLYTFVTESEICGLLEEAGITPITRNRFSEIGLAGTEDPCIIVQGRKHA